MESPQSAWSHQYPQVGALPAPGVSSKQSQSSLETLVTQPLSWRDTGPQASPSSLACKGKVGPVTSNWPHFLIWLFFSDSVPGIQARCLGFCTSPGLFFAGAQLELTQVPGLQAVIKPSPQQILRFK